MSLEVICLGTGTSAGIPMIGCRCDVCRSTDPRDQRSRASVLVQYPDPGGGPMRRFLIDTATEMRQQILRCDIDRIDGVFYTHNHADHVFGIDDLRRFNAVSGMPLDIFGESAVIDFLRSTFRYIFSPGSNVNPSFVATLSAHPIVAGSRLDRFGATWTPVRLMHGRLPIVGYRIDHGGRSMAYCTDVSTIPPQSIPLLSGLDVLVIDALRYRHHPTHMTVDQALQAIDQLQPKRAYLTHIAHDIRHADLEGELPEHVFLAFDGLVIRCADPVDAPHAHGAGGQA